MNTRMKSLAVGMAVALPIIVITGFMQGRSSSATATQVITVYKSPTCGCCSKWIDHLMENGYQVEAHDRNDLARIKTEMGITQQLASCHTAVIDGYVVEGHVPAHVIAKLLDERPEITGLAVPGMPVGSPGMEGPNAQPYDVIAYGGANGPRVYVSVDPNRPQ